MAVYDYRAASGVYGRPPATPKPTAAYEYSGGNGLAAGMTNRFLGDPELRAFRQMALSDAASQASGARASARRWSPNDPSLAGYAGLEGLLRGQGEASRSVGRVSAEVLRTNKQREYEMKVAEAYRRWQREQMESANRSGLIGSLAGLAGTAVGGYFGGR